MTSLASEGVMEEQDEIKQTRSRSDIQKSEMARQL